MLKQVTVSVTLVYAEDRVAAPDVKLLMELFEPSEHGPDAIVPVHAAVSDEQPYLGPKPPELEP